MSLPELSEPAGFTIQDLRAGKEPPRVSRSEPHWYAYLIEEGCVLCGARGGDTRVRMPGQPPDDPADRYVHGGGDWACNDHFM